MTDQDPTFQVPELLTIHDLMSLLQVGRTTAYRLTQDPGFPAPLAVRGCYRWLRAEVMAWLIEQRVADRPARTVRRRAESEISAASTLLPVPRPVARRNRSAA